MASLSLGSVTVPAGHIVGIVASHVPGLGGYSPHPWSVQEEQIIWKVRLARVALGMLVGAALSLAGAAFQGVLRNPLADPFTLGVSSGASVGAAFLLYFGLQTAFFGQWTLPLIAFVTALAALAVVLRMSVMDGKWHIETLILSGTVMQAFLGAVVAFFIAMSKQVINDIVYWLMGSLAMRGWAYPALVGPYVALGFVVLLAHAKALNLFAIGERQAAHLGVNVERTKIVVLVTASMLTAASVSVAGVIGFVGLIVPHLVRLTVGPDYRLLLPLSALGGAIYVLWADTLARTLLSPTEIPIGVVTAFLGAPFFYDAAAQAQAGARSMRGV
ncbi:FecCD family ABC transporter permease [Gordoniibacillus kamchatkensis]|uniref:FecCD family ABC transporter permease n=1 Tax=Gordoniibacillus kamchatkensis TaxID=1590651 RepID=UPI000AAB4374|nr:iron ABC transporter permease [Paenibacillus sp. VKM B-2647]